MDCSDEILRSLGKMGMINVTTKAEKKGFDVYGAQRFVLNYLKQHGPTPNETIVLEARKEGFQPHDDRAWGSVFSWLSRHNEIVCIRADLIRRRGRGASGGRLWRAA
jgi:hypothetical protein